MGSFVESKKLQCAYLPARHALHKIAQSQTSDVGVVLAPASRNAELDEVWQIHLRPRRFGIRAPFIGHICVQYVADGTAELEIRGEYAPAAHGAAAHTCRDILNRLGRRIEQRCAVR